VIELILVFHPGVADDLDAILDYYRSKDPRLPGKFLARLREQADRLQLFPESGAVVFDTYRRVVIKRFPYVAIYRLAEERIEVLAIVSFPRDPATIATMLTARTGRPGATAP
jgi:plasmid stabilization system protein ParE